MTTRRDLLRATMIAGAGVVAQPAMQVVQAACGGLGSRLTSDTFPGGLETRADVNIGYYPYRVCTTAGGAYLLTGEREPGGGKRLVWLENDVEFSVQSQLNADACDSGTTCASSSPRMRPVVQGHVFGYAERHPALGIGAVAAPSRAFGWFPMSALVFVGYVPHTRRLGPRCADFEVHANTDGRRIGANGRLPRRGGGSCRSTRPPRPRSCSSVNSCTMGEHDCDSNDTSPATWLPERAVSPARPGLVLGGGVSMPFQPNRLSPDVTQGDPTPYSPLLYAPSAATKCYLHVDDEVSVLWERSVLARQGDLITELVFYGVEVVSSVCPAMAPVGTRGWIAAYSERDEIQRGRGRYVSVT